MPELPEVETIARDLRENLVGRRIERVEVILPKVVAAPPPETFARVLAGRRITGLDRRGKHLLLALDNDRILVMHLRMTGQLVYSTLVPESWPRHTHLVFYLDRGVLRFNDLRQFGRVHLVPAGELDRVPGLRKLGMEPLDPEFTEQAFLDGLRRSRRQIKPLLLDQTFIAGLGNIYTDEALHRAGIHPARKAADLQAHEARKLYRAVREVLAAGVSFRGTSVQHYVDGAGRPGRFQNILRVYGRQGAPCPVCGTPVERMRCGGRGTHYCPRCQPLV